MYYTDRPLRRWPSLFALTALVLWIAPLCAARALQQADVQIAASAGSAHGSMVASAEIPAPSVGGTIPAGTFTSQVTTSCQPTWLSTFGSQPGLGGIVRSLVVFDDGSGPALYAGGYFTAPGGVAAHGIAKWNGSSWSPLGSGMNGYVSALAVFDDGSGPAV
jgi:hypothetical protein